MSFPFNVDLSTLNSFIAATISSAGFFVGIASFLTGRYLSEWESLATHGKLRTYYVLICSLLILPAINISLTEVLVLLSCQPVYLKAYLASLVFTPIVPMVAILIIVMKKGFGE
jgi:hypothetical protein